MPRPQFTVRALLVAMLVAAAFFGGMSFEKDRRRREDEAAARNAESLRRADEISNMLRHKRFDDLFIIEIEKRKSEFRLREDD